MKKINWFARLFMSWDALVSHIQVAPSDTNTLESIERLYKEQVADLKVVVESKNKIISDLETRLSAIDAKYNKLETTLDLKEQDLSEKNNDLYKLKENITEIRTKLEAKASENSTLKTEISERLIPLATIEKTFFASTGNKGKGELGEMQVKTILEKSGLDVNFWAENLMVGNNIVEFAIRSGEADKWIPVDSKVLDPEIDEDNGLAIIDNSYKSRVNTQAKEVAKYLGKKETANYGILVLQSDSIYMKLFEEFPTFFKETIRDNKIHIMSPSSFVQFAWSIAQILDVYEKVHNDEKIYDEMISALNTVSNFANSLSKVHKDFNSAMEKHYPAIEKKHVALAKKLDKQGKLKEVKSIEMKGKDE